MTSDTTIIERIRAAYDRDDRIPHPASIAVSEYGGTVTLRGTVGSLHQLHAAAEIAKSARGVRRLDNELSLDPRDRWVDGEIRGTALQALMSSDDDLANRVDVHVENGWLKLKGEVKHQEDSDAAFAVVSKVSGVGGITNEIKVVTAGSH